MIGFIGGTIVTWLVLLILSIVLSSFGVSACLLLKLSAVVLGLVFFVTVIVGILGILNIEVLYFERKK